MERSEAPTLSGKQKIQSLLHQWHTFFDAVGDKTTVYYVGKYLTSFSHLCKRTASNILLMDTRVVIEMPAHVAVGAGYCKHCDRLWIAEEAPVGKSQG